MKKHLGDYIKEYSVRNKENQDIPVYSVTNTGGFCQDYFGKEVASKDKSTYKIVPQGYFAYNPSRINVGSVDWQRNQERVIVSPLYNVFSVSDKLNRQYLYYYLKSDFALQRIKAVATGSVRDNLKIKMLYEFPINVPELSVQENIVEVLDKIKELEKLKKSELNQLDTLVKARFVEMFGDPTLNPMKWEKMPLIDKCDIITGNTPSRKIKEYYGDSIEWIKSDNITESAILTTAAEYLSNEGIKVGRKVRAGSILMTCIAGSLHSIGNVAIADREVAFNQQINAIIPKEQNTYFMYEQLKLSKEYICSGVNMALKGILSKSQLAEKKFIFPPLSCQNQFADFLHQTEKSKVAIDYYVILIRKALQSRYHCVWGN